MNHQKSKVLQYHHKTEQPLMQRQPIPYTQVPGKGALGTRAQLTFCYGFTVTSK